MKTGIEHMLITEEQAQELLGQPLKAPWWMILLLAISACGQLPAVTTMVTPTPDLPAVPASSAASCPYGLNNAYPPADLYSKGSMYVWECVQNCSSVPFMSIAIYQQPSTNAVLANTATGLHLTGKQTPYTPTSDDLSQVGCGEMIIQDAVFIVDTVLTI